MSREGASALLWVAFFVAVFPNSIEAFADPDGRVWNMIRFAASTVFTVALVLWIVVYIRERRARRAA